VTVAAGKAFPTILRLFILLPTKDVFFGRAVVLQQRAETSLAYIRMCAEMLYLSVKLLLISMGCDGGEVRERSESLVDPGFEP